MSDFQGLPLLTGGRARKWAIRIGRYICGGALGHDIAAVPAGSGAHVHQVVRGIEQVLVVFHAEDGVPGIPQTEKGCQEKGHFIEVKAAGGFVQNEQGPFPVFRQFPGQGFGQFRSYFYALGFSAGKVSALRLRLRYPSPTSCIFSGWQALGREEKIPAASSTVRASAWAMDFPFR